MQVSSAYVIVRSAIRVSGPAPTRVGIGAKPERPRFPFQRKADDIIIGSSTCFTMTVLTLTVDHRLVALAFGSDFGRLTPCFDLRKRHSINHQPRNPHVLSSLQTIVSFPPIGIKQSLFEYED